MAITDLQISERPREKLLELVVKAVSDAKLFAIFCYGKSAVDLARDLLTQFGSLNGIFCRTND